LVIGLKSLIAKAFLEKMPVSIQAVYSSIQPLNSAVQAYFIFNGLEEPYTYPIKSRIAVQRAVRLAIN
jgi:hypothetical protein